MDMDRAERLLRLALDQGTTEEERRTAAMALARLIADSDFLPTVRNLVAHVHATNRWFLRADRFFKHHGARFAR